MILSARGGRWIVVCRWPMGQRGREGVGVGNWQLEVGSWTDWLTDGVLGTMSNK